MSLFNLSDLKKEKPVADVIKAVRTKEKIRVVIGKATKSWRSNRYDQSGRMYKL